MKRCATYLRALFRLLLSGALLLCWPASASAEQPASAAAAAGPASVAAPQALSPRPQPTVSDVARAKDSFKAGAAAYAAGEYLAAIQALEAAYVLTPMPAIAFSLAQAERRQYFVERDTEHLVRSIALFRRYVEQVPNGGRRNDALDALGQLEPIAARAQASINPRVVREDAPPSTRLMVVSEAPGARIWIDGVDVAGSPLIREVTPGKHQVSVRAPGFHEAGRDVVAVAGELIPISVPLVELPSTLEVAAPEDAEIYVDGAFVSLGGEAVVLELKSGRHRVSVAEVGHRVSSQVLECARGARQRAAFTLEPTTQRIASHGLLIGSAAALGAGALLSVLAIQSENDAQAFLAKRSSGNVTRPELVRYEANVTLRDRYRIMAGAGFATALGLIVTGLFLHELDTPRAEDLNRGSLDLSAVLAPGQIGASLQGRF